MRTTRCVRWLIVWTLFLTLGATAATAAPRLELHWNKGTASSTAVVKNSGDDVMAEVPWGGAVPGAYSADEEEAELPILILALLRDQLQVSVQPEADEALGFVRELMEFHADTPAEQLPPSLGVWIPYSALSVEEHCGTSVDSNGECNDPSNSPFQNTLCSSFACKKTTLGPAE